MPEKKLKKTTTVHAHPMHIPPSKKHPLGGITTRRQHARRVYTSYGTEDLQKIAQNYNLKKVKYPTPNKLKFDDGNQKDLLNPEIGIPCGVRWIFHKKMLAENKLKRPPTPEEIILEYKGLLKSTTDFKNSALENFRENYAKLNKK